MSKEDLQQEAMDFAKQAYQHHKGDVNKAGHEIHKKYAGHIVARPDVSDIRAQRMSELSSAYLRVIDDERTHGRVGRVAEDHWDRAKKGLAGHSGRGNEFAPSQQMALQLGDKGKEFLTEHVQKLKGHRISIPESSGVRIDHGTSSGSKTSFSKGAGGKIAGVAVAVGLAVGGGAASASEIADAALPGANFSGQKSLCRQFGEVSGVIAGAAAGIVTAPVVTPLGGIAVGVAVDMAAGKITDMACGPG